MESAKNMTGTTGRSYAEELVIDKFDLAYEWMDQSTRYMRWAELAADSIHARDKAKEKLEYYEAELDAEVRAGWDGLCPGQKITEGGIKSWVRTQPKYRQTVDELNMATHNMNLLIAARTAFDHRKKALEEIDKLFLAGYFSKPTISEESRYKAEQARVAGSSAVLAGNERVMAAAAGRRRPGSTPPPATEAGDA